MGAQEEKRVLRLDVSSIRPNPRQPRRMFDEAGLRELAASIRRHGILQPLTVRRQAGGWELVAGERRLRAARLAGLDTVPCIEAEVDSRESALLALVEIYSGRTSIILRRLPPLPTTSAAPEPPRRKRRPSWAGPPPPWPTSCGFCGSLPPVRPCCWSRA